MTDDTNSETPSANPEQPRGEFPVGGFLIGFILIAVIAGAGYYFATKSPDGAKSTMLAEQAFNRGEYEKAYELASQAWDSSPTTRMARIAGECAQRQDDFEGALKWYRRLEDDDSEDYLKGTIGYAILAMNVGYFEESEKAFGVVSEKLPTEVQFRRDFGKLLSAEGRRWEASEHFFATVRHGVASGQTQMDDLLLLANFEAPFAANELIGTALKANPDDPTPELGNVLAHYIFNRYDEGIEICRRVVQKKPELAQAQAWLARGLIDSDKLGQIPSWNATLPASAEDFPAVWHMRGVWAEKVGQKKAAARCFWEAVAREPDYLGASYQLGLVLVALGEDDKAQPFLKRHALLSKYHQVTHPIRSEGPKLESLKQLVDLSGQLGRQWEQLAWVKFLIVQAQTERNEKEYLAAGRIYEQLSATIQTTQPPRVVDEMNLAKVVDLSDYPLPDWSKSTSTSDGGSGTSAPESLAGIRFDDIGPDIGLDFTYFNSADRKTQGMRIFESTGGGVAAFDFDSDGWPDLYFTQGALWPVNRDEAVERDKLFRNLNGERVVEVTELAGLGDLNYSQGVNVGDVDGDGFQDLYVANIGMNRLYHNNGDGTFTEMSAGINDRTRRWTSSTLVADLNADGLPDLFDVNYLSGDEVYDRLCGSIPGADGKVYYRTCAPSAFAGEQDEVFLNNGDGSFRNATVESGLEEAKGKGLGVVAADFDGNGQLNVFVANDGIANFYFVSEVIDSKLTLRESAQERGVAFDYDSRGQACMGVAVDDYDGNERLDLFVTNYYEDSNTLYQMTDELNMFEDKTRERKLRTPSFNFLGFGTQFLDVNLDGLPDLVLTNGHVDDFSHEGTPFRMRPQVYANLGREFQEVKPPADSKYMNKQQLGRGLARLDFNRDGRSDFAVTHLDTPAALALNRTENAGNSLTVRLIGVESNRDAIGTTVTVQSKNGRRSMQLTAGDGYQAANERKLNFGLGSAEEIDRIVVQWASGVRQTFASAPINGEITIREDDPLVYPVPR